MSGVGPVVLPPDLLDWVCQLVRTETSVVLDASQDYLVVSRLRPLAVRAGATDVVAYLRRLRSGPVANHREVVEAMTTNETSWFRDGEPFRYLQQVALPALAAARGRGGRLRIWSAACSTGQEPYGLAMIVADAPELAGTTTEILATDVDRSALATAQAATYSQMEVGRGLPAAMTARHLERSGLRWKVRDEVSRRVRFREANLARPAADLGRFDVVFCRNVLIYFDAPTRLQVLARLHAALAPDGLLVLGAGESAIEPGGPVAWARVGTSLRAGMFRPVQHGAVAFAGPEPRLHPPRATGFSSVGVLPRPAAWPQERREAGQASRPLARRAAGAGHANTASPPPVRDRWAAPAAPPAPSRPASSTEGTALDAWHQARRGRPADGAPRTYGGDR